jgi:methyl-accepting chemotaxis protein
MHKILDLLLPRHSEAAGNARLYEQLPYVAYTTLTLAILFLILELVLLANGLYLIVASLFVDLASVLFAIILLRKGKYKTASILTTIALIWAACAFLFLMPYVGNNAREIYRGLAFAAVLAAINMAVALDKKQVWLYFAIFSLAWLACFFSIFAHYYSEDRMEYLSILFTGSLGFVFESIMLALARSLSDRLVAKAAEQQEKSENALKRLTELLAGAREGMSIGDKVVQATARAEDAALSISRLQDYLALESRRLLGEAVSLQDSSRSVLVNTRGIEEALESQNAAILETSTALVQITQNIENIDKVASQRRAMLAEASTAGAAQRALAEKLHKAFDSVRDSSEGIKRFTATVQDIASRTSLLSMNASIEAARAGASGKGFGVVAQEIRSLSNETQKNSDLIQETVKRNEVTVSEAGKLVADFSEFIVKNIESINNLIDSIDEILGGISEMHGGTREVTEAVQDIVVGMHASGEKAKSAAEEIDGQQAGFAHLSKFAKELDSRISELRLAVEEIRGSTASAAEAGKLNIEQVKRLQLGD